MGLTAKSIFMTILRVLVVIMLSLMYRACYVYEKNQHIRENILIPAAKF